MYIRNKKSNKLKIRRRTTTRRSIKTRRKLNLYSRPLQELINILDLCSLVCYVVRCSKYFNLIHNLRCRHIWKFGRCSIQISIIDVYWTF